MTQIEPAKPIVALGRVCGRCSRSGEATDTKVEKSVHACDEDLRELEERFLDTADLRFLAVLSAIRELALCVRSPSSYEDEVAKTV